jgi:predicted  nucleic acid-binding Zn-ribbon protein
MTAESLNNELNNLERRIKLIISEQVKLKNEVEMYQNENHQLREKISQKERELNNFQNKFKLNQIADNAIESANSDELKELLNNYINEIDKCILHLSEA